MIVNNCVLRKMRIAALISIENLLFSHSSAALVFFFFFFLIFRKLCTNFFLPLSSNSEHLSLINFPSFLHTFLIKFSENSSSNFHQMIFNFLSNFLQLLQFSQYEAAETESLTEFFKSNPGQSNREGTPLKKI